MLQKSSNLLHHSYYLIANYWVWFQFQPSPHKRVSIIFHLCFNEKLKHNVVNEMNNMFSWKLLKIFRTYMFLWAPMEGCFWLYSRPFKNGYFPIESARVHLITLIFATFMYVIASNLTKIKVDLNLYPTIFRSVWSFLSLPELQVRVFSLLVITGQNLKPLSHAEEMLKIRWGV